MTASFRTSAALVLDVSNGPFTSVDARGGRRSSLHARIDMRAMPERSFDSSGGTSIAGLEVMA